MPSLLEEPIPPLVHVVEANPYNDPLNPPSDPDKSAGFCGIQWTNNTDPGKINQITLKDSCLNISGFL